MYMLLSSLLAAPVRVVSVSPVSVGVACCMLIWSVTCAGDVDGGCIYKLNLMPVC